MEAIINRKFDEWADLIDAAKKRGAIGDLSVLAYQMAKVILMLQTQLASQLPNKADRESCGFFAGARPFSSALDDAD